MFSVYLPAELKKLKFAELGKNVLIKKTVKFYNPEKIALKSNIIIDDYSIISANEMVVIGNNVHIHSHVCLYGRFGIELGDFSGVSARSVLYTESDDFSGHSLTGPTVPDEYKPRYHTGRIRMGRHSMIGSNSTVLPGVDIGEGAVVGAHSLVKAACAPWYIYVGVPAQQVKKRSDALLELEGKYRAEQPLKE